MDAVRNVADLGNTRLKWGRVDRAGRLGPVSALPPDDPEAWEVAWPAFAGDGDMPTSWAVSSVNPPVAARFATFLEAKGVAARWFRSAADVPLSSSLRHPETAGADRALAVAAALGVARNGSLGPGLVVLCGTAVTVERVGPDGVWQGGAIAAGLALTARALHTLTAQLPMVSPRDAPPPWGDSTRPALEAGVFWGVVGSVRELLTRQAEGFGPADPWVVWSGGDADVLARAVGWPGALVVPDLVLHGLARVGFVAS